MTPALGSFELGFLNTSAGYAGRAGAHSFMSSVGRDDSDPLQIGIPDLFRTVVGVADVHPDQSSFSAYFACFRHFTLLAEIGRRIYHTKAQYARVFPAGAQMGAEQGVRQAKKSVSSSSVSQTGSSSSVRELQSLSNPSKQSSIMPGLTKGLLSRQSSG